MIEVGHAGRSNSVEPNSKLSARKHFLEYLILIWKKAVVVVIGYNAIPSRSSLQVCPPLYGLIEISRV